MKTKKLYNFCVKAYEKSGKTGVIELCDKHGLHSDKVCIACDDITPTIDGACAVCGTEKRG